MLSASRQDYLIEQVSQRGLAGYFTELLGLQDIYGASKVQRGLTWLQSLDIPPERCVMVGDTITMQRWQKPWAPSVFCTQAAINPGSGLLRYAPMLLTGWTHCLHCWHSRNKKAPALDGCS